MATGEEERQHGRDGKTCYELHGSSNLRYPARCCVGDGRRAVSGTASAAARTLRDAAFLARLLVSRGGPSGDRMIEPQPASVGEVLKYLRRRARLTQRQLGLAVGYA